MLIQITFRTTEDDSDQTKDEGKRRNNECYQMNFVEGTVLTRFPSRVIIIWEVLR